MQQILSAIANENDEELSINLLRLPLKDITKDNAETLINYFLEQAFKKKNKQAIRTIVSIFDSARIQDVLPAITNLCLNPLVSRELLLFVFECHPQKTALDYFVDLINMGDDNIALKVAGILNGIFPNMTKANWSLLYKLTDNVEEEEYENQLLRAFFNTKVIELSKHKEKPSWVRTLPPCTITTFPVKIPSVRKAVELIFNDFKKATQAVTNDEEEVDDNELKENLISQYSISISLEKINMLKSLTHITLFDDRPLFNEYGPVNTIYTVITKDHEHICSKYGGCRMFLCTEFEQLNSNGYEIDCMAVEEQYIVSDWFRGSCDECMHKIEHKHHAIRLPLRHGGWKGCYCSIECMKPYITDKITAVMVGRIKEQLEIIGIRDR